MFQSQRETHSHLFTKFAFPITVLGQINLFVHPSCLFTDDLTTRDSALKTRFL